MRDKTNLPDDGVLVPRGKPPLVRRNALNQITGPYNIDEQINAARKEVAQAQAKWESAIAQGRSKVLIDTYHSMLKAAQRRLDNLLYEKENPLAPPGIRSSVKRRARVHF
jgi:hypothetical protein